MNDRFELEGVAYYQATHICHKEPCKCHAGHPHGPYWYSRERANGQVRYLGRELPKEIVFACTAHALRTADMTAHRSKLLDTAAALHHHIMNLALSPADRQILTDLGYGQTLVSEASPRSGPGASPRPGPGADQD